MKCWRTIKRRELTRYVTDGLTPERVQRVEDHLLDCGDCRDAVARLRGGQHFAAHLPRVTPQRDVWDAIEAAIDKQEASAIQSAPVSRRTPRWRALLPAPRYALLTAAVVILSAVTFFALRHHAASEQEPAGLKTLEAVDWDEFHPVSISNIERNTKPHVVAEGYVSEVRVNDEDGDLSFKLVDRLGEQERFIVCEIIDPIRLKPPAVGSRVRVYGVSRYDGEHDHNWYEVHPVLNIEVVH
ncbi:MAG: zf-HC2 domain-containing protein [Blastocatellia bacterium]